MRPTAAAGAAADAADAANSTPRRCSRTHRSGGPRVRASPRHPVRRSRGHARRVEANMIRQFEWYNTPGDADRLRVAVAHLQGPAGAWWATLPQPRPPRGTLFLAASSRASNPSTALRSLALSCTRCAGQAAHQRVRRLVPPHPRSHPRHGRTRPAAPVSPRPSPRHRHAA